MNVLTNKKSGFQEYAGTKVMRHYKILKTCPINNGLQSQGLVANDVDVNNDKKKKEFESQH